VITHGAEPTIVVSAANPEEVKTYAVHVLKDEEIEDTNGAGDAFAGGFMGAIVAGKDVDVAVKAGQKLAAMCVQLVRFLFSTVGAGCSLWLMYRVDRNTSGLRFRSSSKAVYALVLDKEHRVAIIILHFHRCFQQHIQLYIYALIPLMFNTITLVSEVVSHSDVAKGWVHSDNEQFTRTTPNNTLRYCFPLPFQTTIKSF
jgi:hypothetical protein